MTTTLSTDATPSAKGLAKWQRIALVPVGLVALELVGLIVAHTVFGVTLATMGKAVGWAILWALCPPLPLLIWLAEWLHLVNW